MNGDRLAWTCPDCERERPRYALGVCNGCYKKRRGYDKPPSWLSRCQRCARAWSSANHKAFGLCSSCYLYTQTRPGEANYYAARFENNRPDKRKRLLSPENLTALRLARLVGSSQAAQALGVSLEDFRAWCANRERVPKRHRDPLAAEFRRAWLEARERAE